MEKVSKAFALAMANALSDSRESRIKAEAADSVMTAAADRAAAVQATRRYNAFYNLAKEAGLNAPQLDMLAHSIADSEDARATVVAS